MSILNGNVGIGTATPGASLDVAGVIRGTGLGIYGSGGYVYPTGAPSGSWIGLSSPLGNPGISINEGNGSGATLRRWDISSGSGKLQIYDSTASSTRLVIDTSGNVGIGTTNPARPLTLNYFNNAGASGEIGLQLQNTSSFNSTQLAFNASNLWAFVADGTANTGRFYLTNYTTGILPLVFNNAGNVGVGAAAPIGKLDIAGGADSTGANDQYDIALQYRNGGYRHHITSRHNGGGQSGNSIDFYLWNQGTDAVGAMGTKHVMTLDGTGNVGIGTTSPQSKFNVYSNGTGLSLEPGNGTTFFGTLGFNREASNGNIMASGHNAYQFTNFDSRFQLEVYNGGGTAVTYSALAVNSSGNVGIGTTAPTQRLDLGGGNISMGYEIITSALCTSSSTGWASCTATCSAGKQALGGSCGTGCCTRAAEYTTITSTSYTCGIYQTNGANAFTATVVCANIK